MNDNQAVTDEIFFTIKEFAQIHHINKRTLHYYDEIQLFSPQRKDTNGYRYYSASQSARLEYILALKELGMSMKEIKHYVSDPNPDELLHITNQKLTDIDDKINQLQHLKHYLKEKQMNMKRILTIQQDQIIIKEAECEYLYCSERHFSVDELKNTDIMMEHLCHAWKYHPFKIGCGSYIHTDKIKQGDFQTYDGLFSVIDQQPIHEHMHICEQGTYLYAYHIGAWNEIPTLYQKIQTYAYQHHYRFSGYAYERGISELSLLSSKEYVTEIKIKCEKINMNKMLEK